MATPYSAHTRLECQTCFTLRLVRHFPKNRFGIPVTEECIFCRRKREAAEALLTEPLSDEHSPEAPALPSRRPAPPWLFYRTDQWTFVQAPDGSEPLSAIEDHQRLLPYLLRNSEETTIPAIFLGSPQPDAGSPFAHIGSPYLRPCRVWRGETFESGYGLLRIKWRHSGLVQPIGAHRARLFARDGCLLPPEIVARHLCHNHPCIEVSHLAWGTDLDNYGDEILKNTLRLIARYRPGPLATTLAVAIRLAAVLVAYDTDDLARKTGVLPEVIASVCENPAMYV